jgi:hypothetical protein
VVHPAGVRALAPLVVSFRSDEIPLLHRLQYDRAGGELTTEAFVMAQDRMEPADGSAETLYAAPAGFGGAATGFGLAEGWLTQLRFVRNTDEQLQDSSLIASANFEHRPTLTRKEIVRVPVSTCSDSGGCSGGGDHDDHDDDGCLCSTRPLGSDRFGSTLGPSLLACLWLAWRSRRARR